MMQIGPGDFGSLLYVVVMMAVLSLMDALARRQRRRRAEELDQAGAGDGRPATEEPPLEAEPAAGEWIAEGAGGRPAAAPTPAGKPRAAEPPAAAEPPLVAAAEELRERARRELLDHPSAPPVGPAADAPVAGEGVRDSAPGRAARAARLRRAFAGDRTALRRAVLYREILGAPLGSRPRPGGWEEPEGA